MSRVSLADETQIAILEAQQPDVLPNSRMRNPKSEVQGYFPNFGRINYVQIFCANCGADGGYVPVDSCDFAFYLCDAQQNNCAAKWQPLANTCLIPDEVFWRKVKLAQFEHFGRELTAAEIIEALKDENHILSKLAKERK